MKFLNKKKLAITTSAVVLSLVLSSCSAIETFYCLTYKVISSPGLYSFTMSGYYYEDDYFFVEKDDKKIEEAFKSDEYGIISYDTIKGLKLCEQYGKFKYLNTYNGPTHVFVSLKEDVKEYTPGLKIVANNKDGILGVEAKRAMGDEYSNITFVDKTDIEFCTEISQGLYSSDYDCCIIANPYGEHLTNGFFKFNQTFKTLRYLKNYEQILMNDGSAIYPECSIFVNLDVVNASPSTINTFNDFKVVVPKWVELTKKDRFDTSSAIKHAGNYYSDQWDKYCLSLSELYALNTMSEYDTSDTERYDLTGFMTDYTVEKLKTYLDTSNITFSDFDSLIYQEVTK